jgi:peptidoglycan-N-acetylglucosamine deacetylase
VNGPVTPPRGFHVVGEEENEKQAARAPLARIERLLTGEPAIVYRGAGRRPEIALTFDDGPSRWTRGIARVFEEHGCQATFFLRGAAVAQDPEAVAALAGAGHELGNHLWSHADPRTQSRSEIRTEIERAAAAIERAGGDRPRLVRPPYCRAASEVARAARRMGVRRIVLRSVGSSDWAATSPEQVVEPLLACAEPGAIICMHDGISPDERDSDSRQPTAEGVARLVPALIERGLRPVTVSRLLR